MLAVIFHLGDLYTDSYDWNMKRRAMVPQDKAQNMGFLVFTVFVATKMIIPVLSYNIKLIKGLSKERVNELIRT